MSFLGSIGTGIVMLAVFVAMLVFAREKGSMEPRPFLHSSGAQMAYTLVALIFLVGGASEVLNQIFQG